MIPDIICGIHNHIIFVTLSKALYCYSFVNFVILWILSELIMIKMILPN